MTGVQTLAVSPEEAELRLDRWFRRRFPGLGHGRLSKLLRTGQVRVDGKRADGALRLEPGMQIRVPPLDEKDLVPRVAPPPKRAPDAKAVEALREAVIFRDPEVLIIDKPAGLAVQGGTGIDQSVDSMLDGLRFEARERPKLVHRLDRDTSGVLVLARSSQAAKWLTAAFRARETEKVYWAVLQGVPKPARGRVDIPLAKVPGPAGEKMIEDDEGGKRAVTYYTVLDRAAGRASWVALLPVTGRTHQLRAHCAALGTPIVGDGKYGGRTAFIEGPGIAKRLHLHARSISLEGPDGRAIEARAPLPPHMANTFKAFGFDPKDAPRDPFAELAGEKLR
jgi:23S rRNA pseudouridine955/2504/2580 synthase